jgi:hypothetical protein
LRFPERDGSAARSTRRISPLRRAVAVADVDALRAALLRARHPIGDATGDAWVHRTSDAFVASSDTLQEIAGRFPFVVLRTDDGGCGHQPLSARREDLR